MNNSNNNDNNKQNYNNNIQSQPLNQKQIKKQEEAEAAQDVAHTVGKGAATYYGGAVGNQLYDIASKTKLGKSIERNAGKMAMKNPLLKPAMKNLHKSGATKVANNIIDNLGSKKGSTTAMNKGAKSTNKDLGLASKNKMTLPSRNTQRVTPNFSEQQPDFDNMTEEQIEEYQNQQEELKRQQINREKQEKRKAKAKSFIQFLKKHPHIALFLGFGIFLFVLLLILLYVFTADVDLVGTRGVSYNSAATVTGYCDHIILIKEHDSFTGKPVASIDDVDLEETFRLNNADVKRWQYKTIKLEDYIKGVLQAEASIIKDEKTYEVASIVARTYAVEITSKNCYTWNNENKRDEYKNPQDYTSGKVDDDISSAVSTTTGLVAYDKDNIIDMSNNNYYDYFCYKEITNDKDEEKSYYRMSQENKEENLLIPVDWTKDDNNVADGNAKKWNYSGKYSGGIYTNDCQEDGLSLYGAKYLLNKKFDSYTTIRTLMYYYTYDLELKKIDTISLQSCGPFSLTKTSLTRDQFISAINQYNKSAPGFQTLKSYAGQIYDLSVSNNFNPELIYARADVEGYSPGGTTYNYYGIGCFNNGGSRVCHSYSSVMDGVMAYMKIMQNYGVDNLYDVYYLKHYAYIGDFWNKGSSGSGGCYYLEHMEKYYTNVQRYNILKYACDTNTGGNIPTNDEDQAAYSHYQIESMVSARKRIFNIDSESCENSNGDIQSILNGGGTIGDKAAKIALTFDSFGYNKNNRFGSNQVDCSSLVYRTYTQLGINFGGGTTVKGEYNWCKENKKLFTNENLLQPGDLIMTKTLSHVELYMGNGQRFGAHTDDYAYEDQVSMAKYTSGYFTIFCRPY